MSDNVNSISNTHPNTKSLWLLILIIMTHLSTNLFIDTAICYSLNNDIVIMITLVEMTLYNYSHLQNSSSSSIFIFEVWNLQKMFVNQLTSRPWEKTGNLNAGDIQYPHHLLPECTYLTHVLKICFLYTRIIKSKNYKQVIFF